MDRTRHYVRTSRIKEGTMNPVSVNRVAPGASNYDLLATHSTGFILTATTATI